MTEEPFWKRELKALVAISSTFFVFLLILLVFKKLLLDEYKITFSVGGIALIGSLIFAKVVLIFENIPLAKKYDHLPKIYSVLTKSFVYILGYIIFTLLEHCIKGLIKGDGFVKALDDTFNNLMSKESLINIITVFIIFLLFNTFWVIRNYIGANKLYKLFFKEGE